MTQTTEITFKAKGISLSEIGAVKLREYLKEQEADAAIAGLRIGVKGGGCSGFQYQLAFDQQRENDIVFDNDGLKLLVDPKHLAYVDGSEIDYVESLQGAGFEINNPNTVASCGCGTSFQIKEEETEPVSAL